MKHWIGALALVSLVGCAGALEGPTVEERTAIAESGDGATGAQQAVLLADSMFDFDPTLDPAGTPEANATAIGDHTRTGLNGCGTVSVAAATVTVSFGAGCTFANGLTASGSVSAGVSRAGATTTVALTFTALTVNGHGLSGTASFATMDARNFTVNAMLTSGGNALTVTNLAVTGSPNTLTASGAVTVTHAGTTSALVLTGVVWHPGDCYPSAGSMAVTRGAVSVTVGFTAATASTGEVTVTQGRRSYSATLPAYGACPTGSAASDGGRG